MNIRLVTRVVTFDQENRKILLVKNKDQDFWYPPGGGWEYEKENIVKCAEREVFEETGLKIKIVRLLYLQEFHETPDSISFETIWLAKLVVDPNLNELHVDHDVDGKVEIAKWFTKEELRFVNVFPVRLKDSFWDNVEVFLKSEDPFIGVS